MHATQVPRPFHTKGWVYEEKIDGWRMLAVKEAGGVRLISRNGRDHTKRFHAVAEALAARAVREEKNLETLVAEILETAAGKGKR